MPYHVSLVPNDFEQPTDYRKRYFLWQPLPSHVSAFKNSKTSTDGQILSSSSLTIPDPIPGFEARLLFDREPSLQRWMVLDTVVETMKYMALKSWDEALSEAVTMRSFSEMLVISPWPQGASSLLVKHAVVALYKAGTALAEIAIEKRGAVPRLYAGLFLQNQPIGYLKWMHGSSSLGSEVNSNLSLIDASNSTAALQVAHSNQPAVKGSRKMRYPDDSKFVATYELGDRQAALPDIFSALVEAFADAAPHENSAVGAYANGISISGNVAVNVHGRDTLSWENLVRALFVLWTIIAQNHLVDIDFTFAYDGVFLGEGSV